MKKTELIESIIRNYFIIFTVIILGTSLLNPTHAFTFREIMLSALFALAGDLPILVFYTKRELSSKSRYLRMIVHIVLLEVVILCFGNIMGQVSGLAQNLLFGFEIFIIYILVKFISWLIDHKTANDINTQIAKIKSVEKTMK